MTDYHQRMVLLQHSRRLRPSFDYSTKHSSAVRLSHYARLRQRPLSQVIGRFRQPTSNLGHSLTVVVADPRSAIGGSPAGEFRFRLDESRHTTPKSND
jgi:hypothetical protein